MTCSVHEGQVYKFENTKKRTDILTATIWGLLMGPTLGNILTLST